MPQTSRDSWCTPQWLAEALGGFDLDPCSNEHSHIWADRKGGLVYGLDGLRFNPPSTERVFINPPYSRGQVARWVAHYKHTDFCFLLRWDPSTAWFRELMDVTNYVWFASRRINFEPPPGIASSSNPFPHALYFRSRPPTSLEGLGITLTNQRDSSLTTNDPVYRHPRTSPLYAGDDEPLSGSWGG